MSRLVSCASKERWVSDTVAAYLFNQAQIDKLWLYVECYDCKSVEVHNEYVLRITCV